MNFPRNGAFVFVWEYLHPSRMGLTRVPRRPAHFRLAAGGRVRQTCDGSNNTFGCKDAGQVFQVEVYLGPGIEPALRAQR